MTPRSRRRSQIHEIKIYNRRLGSFMVVCYTVLAFNSSDLNWVQIGLIVLIVGFVGFIIFGGARFAGSGDAV